MITPATIILLIFLWYKRNNLTVAIYIAFFTSIFVKAGFVISFGSIEVLYGQFFALYSILLYIIYGSPHLNVRLLTNILLFILLFLLSYIFVMLYQPSDITVYANGTDYAQGILTFPAVTQGNIKEFINIIIYCLFLIAIYKVDKVKLCEFIIFSGKFVILLVLFEFVLKNIFGSDIFALTVDLFFGKGTSQIDFLFERGNYFALQGLTREPNQLVRGLLVWFLLVILMNKREPFFIPLAFFILFTSGSFAGSILILFLLSLIFIRNFGIKMIPLLFLLGIGLVYIFIKTDISYYLERLIVIEDDARIKSIAHAYKVFLTYPFLGVGLGNSMAFSGTMTLLSNLGIFGCISWVLMSTSGMRYNKKSYVYLAVFSVVFIFLGGKDIAYTAYTAMLFLMLDRKVLK